MINKFLNKIGITSKLTRNQLQKFIERHQSEAYTLEIGCAYSPYAAFFPNRVGLDIKQWPGVDVIGDAHNLPFKDEKFDNILCIEVLEHLHSPQEAVAEMRRVLKPGGNLILSTRFIFPIHDAPDDFFRFTKYGLQHLFDNGWKIIELEKEADTKQTIAILVQRIAYQTQFKGGFFGSLIKLLFFLVAKIIYYFPSFIKKEYGDLNHVRSEKNILASGYYLVCQKI